MNVETTTVKKFTISRKVQATQLPPEDTGRHLIFYIFKTKILSHLSMNVVDYYSEKVYNIEKSPSHTATPIYCQSPKFDISDRFAPGNKRQL